MKLDLRNIINSEHANRDLNISPRIILSLSGVPERSWQLNQESALRFAWVTSVHTMLAVGLMPPILIKGLKGINNLYLSHNYLGKIINSKLLLEVKNYFINIVVKEFR